MTREEFIAKYGDVKVTFTCYYKYTFSFSGTCDNGYDIFVDVGGNGDNIYSLGVGSDPIAIKNLDIVSGEVRNNEYIVDSFYDY